MFILTFTIALFLFFSNKRKFVYGSFLVLGFSSIVRYEGILLLLPFTIMLFIRLRREPRLFLKVGIALLIFSLSILPMIYLRIDATGRDGIFSQSIAGPIVYQKTLQESEEGSQVLKSMLVSGFSALPRYLITVTIPIFIILVPLGVYITIKNREYKNNTLILICFIMLIPAFYAYTRGIQETKYLLILFPIFSVFSVYAIKLFDSKINHRTVTFVS